MSTVPVTGKQDEAADQTPAISPPQGVTASQEASGGGPEGAVLEADALVAAAVLAGALLAAVAGALVAGVAGALVAGAAAVLVAGIAGAIEVAAGVLAVAKVRSL
jgi:hypothetical protein